jgi:acetyl esterase/lipase
MTRLLVPELEARRHLIEGYAQFPDVPEDVTNLWKAPFGPPAEWDLCVAERTIDGPHGRVPVRVYMPTAPSPGGGRACLVWMHGGAFAWATWTWPRRTRSPAASSNAVTNKLVDLTRRRLRDEVRPGWQQAYVQRGPAQPSSERGLSLATSTTEAHPCPR